MAEREFEGRTEEEAIDKAIEALGLTEDEIDVEVVDEQRPGFLKGGKVRIRVHLADDDGEAAELEPENAFEERMVEFVTELLEKANLPADVRIDQRENGRLTLDILADDPAIVIGKHGATLEALQLISNIHAGRINDGEPVRIILDTEDYRYRREQSLLRMATRGRQRGAPHRQAAPARTAESVRTAVDSHRARRYRRGRYRERGRGPLQADSGVQRRLKVHPMQFPTRPVRGGLPRFTRGPDSC